MLYMVVSRKCDWLGIKVDGYEPRLYQGYSLRNAIKEYRLFNGLKGKHIAVIKL